MMQTRHASSPSSGVADVFVVDAEELPLVYLISEDQKILPNDLHCFTSRESNRRMQMLGCPFLD
jgi:hypothetical protein